MQKDERNQRRLTIGISRNSAIRLLAAFAGGMLIGRVNIEQVIYPFGIAYMLAAYRNAGAVNPYMAAGGVFTALALSAGGMQQPAYCFSVVAICAALIIMASCLKLQESYWLCCGIALLAYLAGTIAFRLQMLLAVAASLLELIITILMVLVMDKAFGALGKEERSRVYSDEQLISLCFCGLICIMGLGNLGLYGIYLREVLCACIAFTAGYAGGAAIGAAAGATAAFASTIAGTDGLYIGYMGILGMAAGICRNYGKWACAGGGAVAGILGAVYIGYGQISVPALISIGIGTLLFVLLPGRLLNHLAEYVDANMLQEQQWNLKQQRFRELTFGRLTEAAGIFAEAAELISETAEPEKIEKISYSIADIPDIACRGCTFYKGCWHEDFDHTYELMQKLYDVYREKGIIREKDLGRLAKKCLRASKLLATAKEVYERFEINSRWEKRLVGSREAIALQMKGTSSVIQNLAKDIQKDIRFSKELQDAIRSECDKALLDVREVAVTSEQGITRVDILIKTNRPEAAEYNAQKAAAKACGQQLRRLCIPLRQDDKGKIWRLSFETARTFSVQIGAASAAKSGSEISGDAYSHEALKDGRYMLLLCDGMGSGARAARESRMAVSLMEDFYKVGFEEQAIIDIINKLLILSSSDDIYSTLDLAMLDLVEGTARFIKIGAPHSYVVGERGMRKLKAGSLPMGILEEYEPIVYEAKLEPGDTIIMFTDGIADLEDKDDELHEAIRRAARLRNATEAAEMILTAAQQSSGGLAGDDMTVLAARITKPVNKV
ncbi:MAG: hypothetical protein DBY39_02905 [Clostridiales bacterium]|nr:MAG: hypothetical protein DBY39_02905 [Clostridiales bacterium]